MRAPLLALLAGCSGAATVLPDGADTPPDATAPDAAGPDAGPPFSFVLDRTHLSLVGGDSAPVGIRVTRQAGFTGTITVEAHDLPAGVEAPPAAWSWRRRRTTTASTRCWRREAACWHDRLIVVRLSGSSVDTSFGTDGYAEVDPHAAVAELAGCVSLADGGVLLAASVGNPADLLLVRLTAAGATADLDVADAGGNDLAYGVSLQGDRPLIALTHNPPIGPSTAVVARFTAAGTLDPSFDGDGLWVLPGTHAIGAGATPGGITVLGGNFNTLTVWRLDGTSGALLATSELAPGGAAMDRAERARVLPDGAVLAAGHVDDQFGVFLVTPGGSLDAAFSTRFGDSNRMALDATLDAAGRIVVAGTSDADHGALARYLPFLALAATASSPWPSPSAPPSSSTPPWPPRPSRRASRRATPSGRG